MSEAVRGEHQNLFEILLCGLASLFKDFNLKPLHFGVQKIACLKGTHCTLGLREAL